MPNRFPHAGDPDEPSFGFCIKCGSSMTRSTPPGDNLVRLVCESCGYIHYENPRIIVGTLPYVEDTLLLCKRNIEPRYGYWTLPAGFMELGETAEEGALRETMEESGAAVEIEGLHTLYSIPHVGQVYLIYRAKLLNDTFDFGHETQEVRLFSPQDIPWSAIAFSSVRFALEQYVKHPQGDPHTYHIGSHTPSS